MPKWATNCTAKRTPESGGNVPEKQPFVGGV